MKTLVSMAGPPNLHPHLARALKTQWKSYRKELCQSRKKFTIERVHATRIKGRRLLSMLELLGALTGEPRLVKARRLLKKQRDAFDKLRDTHVHLLLIKQWTGRYAVAEQFHRFLEKRKARWRDRTARKVGRLKPRALLRCIKALCAEMERRDKRGCGKADWETLLRAAAGAFATVSDLQRRARAADTASIHRVRLAFKRFRYMLECLAGLLPGATEDYLAVLHAHQTLMGDIQDNEVLTAAFLRFAAKQEIAPARQAVFRRALEARCQRLICAYFRQADRLAGFWPPPQERKGTIKV